MKKGNYSKSYVTITVLILMMVLVAITYFFANSLYAELRIANNNKSAQIAFALAEAAVQDAIYQVKYDTATRTAFVAGDTSCCSKVTKNPALINNGSFDETTTITGPGLATISATGSFTMGTRTAVRRIETSIAQSVTPPVYTGDAAIFVSNSGPNNAGKIYTNQSIIEVFGGSILSGGDLEFKNSAKIYAEKTIGYKGINDSFNSTLKCHCTISTPDPEGLIPMCSAAPNCTPQIISTVDSIPSIDLDSSDSGSYKSRANAQGQYFSSQTLFSNYLQSHSNTISGIVFVDVGSNGTLDFGTLIGNNQTVTVNGILVSSYNIAVPNNRGLTINPNPTTNQPSGIIVKHDFTVATGATFSGIGLFYAGNRIETNHPIFTVTGGIFARDISINQGHLTMHFDPDIINEALPPNPADTPIIQRTFWEEEY